MIMHIGCRHKSPQNSRWTRCLVRLKYMTLNAGWFVGGERWRKWILCRCRCRWFVLHAIYVAHIVRGHIHRQPIENDTFRSAGRRAECIIKSAPLPVWRFPWIDRKWCRRRWRTVELPRRPAKRRVSAMNHHPRTADRLLGKKNYNHILFTHINQFKY